MNMHVPKKNDKPDIRAWIAAIDYLILDVTDASVLSAFCLSMARQELVELLHADEDNR